jgi:NAD(P)-dependent dehydrogenase (short-subunit alcohol dehydrogenase family)
VSSGPFDLTGKVAVVTGGNSGIGLAMANALAAAGASVCVWGRSVDRNAEAVASLRAHGTRASSREVDVTDEAAVVAAMATVMDEWGRIDSFFANASGHGQRSPSFIESTTSEWRATTALVLDSVYVTLREAARLMVAQDQGGSLVATSSVAANYGSVRGNHAYAAAKAAITTLVRGLAVELARYSIRANTIIPGWVDGPFMAEVHANPKLSERVLQRMPMRRWGQPDELGSLAVYLAGDGSTWHTGDEFIVAGGYHVM